MSLRGREGSTGPNPCRAGHRVRTSLASLCVRGTARRVLRGRNPTSEHQQRSFAKRSADILFSAFECSIARWRWLFELLVSSLRGPLVVSGHDAVSVAFLPVFLWGFLALAPAADAAGDLSWVCETINGSRARKVHVCPPRLHGRERRLRTASTASSAQLGAFLLGRRPTRTLARNLGLSRS